MKMLTASALASFSAPKASVSDFAGALTSTRF